MLTPLVEHRIIRLPLHHWIRWYDLYVQLSEGKSRKNGARDAVIGFFTCYYDEHPDLRMSISYSTFDKMLNFMHRKL